MDDRDRWLGRTLMERGLVARDELVAAATVCNAAAQAGRPMRLLEALLASNAVTQAQATWIQTTILGEAPPAAAPGVAPSLAASWDGSQSVPVPAPNVPVPAPVPAAPPPAAPAPEGADPRAGAASSRRTRLRATAIRPAAKPAGKGGVLIAVGAVGVSALVLVAVVIARSRPAPPPAPPQYVLPDPDPEFDVVEVVDTEPEEAAPVASATPATEEAPPPAAPLSAEALAFVDELEASLREGADPALRALVVRIERTSLPLEFHRLPALSAWRTKARARLGGETYDDLALFGDETVKAPRPAPAKAEEPDAGPPLARVDEERRGPDPRRREHLAALARDGAAALASARAALTTAEAEAAARTRAEAERALANPTPVEVPGTPPARGRVVGYDARGFAIEVPGGRRTFTWLDAPGGLGVDVLERALDLDQPDARARLARASMRAGLADRARVHVEAAQRLAPERSFLPYDGFVALRRLSHGEGALTAKAAELRYAFDDPDDFDDFTRGGWGVARVAGGSMYLLCLPSRVTGVHAYVAHSVQFDQGFEAELRLESDEKRAAVKATGELLVGVHEVCAALGPKGVGSGGWATVGAGARTPAKLEASRPIQVRVTRPREDELRLVVAQGERVLVDVTQPAAAWPTALEVGVRDGTTVLAELSVRGHPDADWLATAERERAFGLEVFDDMLDLTGGDVAASDSTTPADARPDGADVAFVASFTRRLPPELALTSAEDPVALEEVPAAAQALLARARAAVRMGDDALALELAREAVARGGRRYFAADHVLAVLEQEEAASSHGVSRAGPRVRLDQAIAGVEGFAEALAARSELHRRDGRLEEARADAEAALAARPDHAPAHLAMAWVLVQEGKLDEAVAAGRLAVALSGGDPAVALGARRLERTRDGPSWNAPVARESAHYALVTDLPDRADEVLAALEAVRKDAPALFPCLRPRAGARERKARVLLFSRREDYARHAWRTSFDRMEHTAGFFDPPSGQLFVFENERGAAATLHALRHEATHQWVHSLGLELPYWANEAIADYVGLWDGASKHSRAEPQRCQALSAQGVRLKPLFDLLTMSPSDFYSGDQFLNYAQAWSFVHLCMEGGDAPLKQTFFQYLERHCEGRAGDKSLRAGTALDHLWVQTFHQLDRKALDAAWRSHGAKLAAEAELAAGTAR